MDRGQTARVLASALTLVGVIGGFHLRAGAPFPEETVRLSQVPLEVGRYTGRDLSLKENVLGELRSDGLLLREYRGPDGIPVWVLVDYHRVSKLGAQVHSPRVCYLGTGWNITDDRVGNLSPGGRPVSWLRLQAGEYGRLVLFWYVTRWGTSAGAFGLKTGIVRSAIGHRPSDAAIVRISAPIVGGDVEDARERILEFLATIEPRLEAELPFPAAAS